MNKFFLIFFMLLISTFVCAQDDLKVEGSCKGQYRGTDISFTYYSAFDGCQKKSPAAISFTSRTSSMLKGSRLISGGIDKYTFKAYSLELKDSTGNKTAIFTFRDDRRIRKSVVLQCEVFDYEYSDCK